jgi:hypothetical protein
LGATCARRIRAELIIDQIGCRRVVEIEALSEPTGYDYCIQVDADNIEATKPLRFARERSLQCADAALMDG